MTKNQLTMEQQLEALNSQVQQLCARVEQLEQCGTNAAAVRPQPPEVPAAIDDQRPSESNLLVGSSSLLQHISAVCFLLVAALGLRALTDSDMLQPQIGTALGMAYAASLIIGGYLFYRKAKSMAPIFTTIGGLLMFSVLVEGYARFASLPDEMVYVMLAVTGICMRGINHCIVICSGIRPAASASVETVPARLARHCSLGGRLRVGGSSRTI